MDMSPASRQARIAGFLYLLDAMAAPLRLVVIPGRLFVAGDARATAANIVAHEGLFRLGILADLFCGVVEIFLVLALYRLFSGTHRRLAQLMVILGLMTTPLFFVNALDDCAALSLARGTELATAFDRAQLDALAALSLRLHHQGILAADVFAGLWLLPLALLVLRCQFLPRFVGYWLYANGLSYVLVSAVGLLAPAREATVATFVLPLQLAEVVFLLWLLVMGASWRPRASAAAPPSPRYRARSS